LDGSSVRPKGRTFLIIFNITQESKKSSHIKKTYKNPIFLAREYKHVIDSGQVKNQAELARLKGISRARFTQILNLVNLDKKTINHLLLMGNFIDNKKYSERRLRKIVPDQ